jgi:hypothetical protein
METQFPNLRILQFSTLNSNLSVPQSIDSLIYRLRPEIYELSHSYGFQ